MLPKEVIRLMRRTIAKTLRKLEAAGDVMNGSSWGRWREKRSRRRAEPGRGAK